jgi:hypothetical protein
MIDTFIAHINATRTWTGLDEIPPGKARPHMFRKTMAMLTDQFAGSEIALGIQLKHVATRALACTQGYVAADVSWAEHLDSAIDAARFRRLEDLYTAHKAGESLGYGPAAERMAKAFEDIQETVKARIGDATVERALLRKARISIRFGTLNHRAFGENNPTGALCLENAIIPPGHTGPLQVHGADQTAAATASSARSTCQSGTPRNAPSSPFSTHRSCHPAARRPCSASSPTSKPSLARQTRNTRDDHSRPLRTSPGRGRVAAHSRRPA